MQKKFLLLLLFSSLISASLEYEYKLLDPQFFKEVNNTMADFRTSRVCNMGTGELDRICKEVASFSINDHNFYVQYFKGQPALPVALSTSFGVVPVVRCSSSPIVYLLDGQDLSHISFMIKGYKNGDQALIHGLHLSAWKEYLEGAKQRLRSREGRSNYPYQKSGSSMRFSKEKIEKHLRKFINMKKRRKERKKKKKRQGGAVAGEEEEEGEEEGGEVNSEEIFGNISEVAEGGFFEGMFSDFIEKIQNIKMPSVEGFGEFGE